MLIEKNKLVHWLNHFYGYGSWQARFWFVGYEENGGDLPEEAAEKFNHFYRSHGNAVSATLCNLRDLFKEVAFRIEGPRMEKFSNFYDHRFGPEGVQHGFWKNMISFMAGYEGKEVPDTMVYQRKKFASPTSQEALLHLYPLPAHNHAWYYGWLDLPDLPFLKTRAQYEKQVYPQRIETILHCINQHKPEMVVMYGMENINALKQSVQEVFPQAKFKTMKMVKHIIPQYHRADLAGTTLLITTQIPGLRHGRKETGFDWYEFGKSLAPTAAI